MMNRWNELKRQYRSIPVPKELDDVVRKAVQTGMFRQEKSNFRRNIWKRGRRAGIGVAAIAACLVIMIAGANINPSFAESLSKVPVVGNFIKIFTIREYTVSEEHFQAEIKAPAIQGLENKELENSLNQKYLAENEVLYEQFLSDMEEMKEIGGGYAGVSSGYEVKTDNERIFSIARYTLKIQASGNESWRHDTIDKKNQILITLPSLFRDDSYIDGISSNIIEQMRAQMRGNSGAMYFIKGDDLLLGAEEGFDQITANQDFYINPEGKLVICFNEYEVAPGAMGAPEFVIPTEVITNILVGDEYIH